MTETMDQYPGPPAPPDPNTPVRDVTELYAREIREHAGLVAASLPPDAAAKYREDCYGAARLLDEAAAVIKPYLGLAPPPPAPPPAPAFSAIAEFVVKPTFAGVVAALVIWTLAVAH